MSLHQVLIGIGGNLDQPQKQVRKAIAALSDHTKLRLKAQSSLYSSRPQGPQDQDDYVNAVVWLETPLNPFELLGETQAIEKSFGRIKTRHWGERVIDLDILFFDQDEIASEKPNLAIPHPYATKRDFVLIPAIEIAPDWKLPDESLLQEYLSACAKHGLHRIE